VLVKPNDACAAAVAAAVALGLFSGCAGSIQRSPNGTAYWGSPERHVEKKTSTPVASGETFNGEASYYAAEFHGRKTASGERYDMNAMTAAHRTLPFGTVVRVTNLDNNATVDVRINDRGPFKRGRVLDVSYAAAKKLGLVGPGTARVRCVVVE
jgi:rare lipoprotein A